MSREQELIDEAKVELEVQREKEFKAVVKDVLERIRVKEQEIEIIKKELTEYKLGQVMVSSRNR